MSFIDVSMTFDNGRSFIGEIDPAKLPNGFGKEFYPSGKLFYKGTFKHGFRDGVGIFYHENGFKGYEVVMDRVQPAS